MALIDRINDVVDKTDPDFADLPAWADGSVFLGGTKATGFMLQEPTPVYAQEELVALVEEERNRRLAAGFDYDFGDGRGVHTFGTTPADMAGWREVTDFANALLSIGDTVSLISVKTDTGFTQVTPTEWQLVLIDAAAFREPIWAASFALKAMDPIPQDYNNDTYWP